MSSEKPATGAMSEKRRDAIQRMAAQSTLELSNEWACAVCDLLLEVDRLTTELAAAKANDARWRMADALSEKHGRSLVTESGRLIASDQTFLVRVPIGRPEPHESFTAAIDAAIAAKE